MRLLYSALFYCLLPFIVLRMLWRSRGAPDYRRRLGERFGLFSPRVGLDQPAIWVHAVSVAARNAELAWLAGGLPEGARVIVYPPADLADGLRVRERAAD